jgi:hypothetical protein
MVYSRVLITHQNYQVHQTRRYNFSNSCFIEINYERIFEIKQSLAVYFKIKTDATGR